MSAVKARSTEAGVGVHRANGLQEVLAEQGDCVVCDGFLSDTSTLHLNEEGNYSACEKQRKGSMFSFTSRFDPKWLQEEFVGSEMETEESKRQR